MVKFGLIKRYERRVSKLKNSCLRICLPARLGNELGLEHDDKVLISHVDGENKFVVEIMNEKRKWREDYE